MNIAHQSFNQYTVGRSPAYLMWAESPGITLGFWAVFILGYQLNNIKQQNKTWDLGYSQMSSLKPQLPKKSRTR